MVGSLSFSKTVLADHVENHDGMAFGTPQSTKSGLDPRNKRNVTLFESIWFECLKDTNIKRVYDQSSVILQVSSGINDCVLLWVNLQYKEINSMHHIL